jgi:hypothetical protein
LLFDLKSFQRFKNLKIKAFCNSFSKEVFGNKKPISTQVKDESISESISFLASPPHTRHG